MDNVKQLLIEFLDSEFLVYALYVYLFALILYTVHLTILSTIVGCRKQFRHCIVV